MQADYWIQRWQEGRTGFHRERVSDSLVRHWPSLGVDKQARVLVPLCGKSLDMLWLAEQEHEVHGIEVSGIAVRDFFDENDIQPRVEQRGRVHHWHAGALHLWEGDFFEIGNAHIGRMDAIYDRAALVALPAPMRERYVAHLRELAADAPILLVTLEYDQSCMEGPPFSVTDAELERHFSTTHTIELLEDIDLMAGDEGERFRQRGLTAMHEKIWRVAS